MVLSKRASITAIMMHEFGFLFLAFLAEVLGTISGFGSSIFFVSVAQYFESIQTVLVITGFLHIVGNLSRLFLFRGIEWRVLFIFGLSTLIPVAVGALMSDLFSKHVYEIVLGAFLIAGTFFLRWGSKSQSSPLRSKAGMISLGVISGFFTGMLGTGGAIRAWALSALDLGKNAFIATSSAIDLVGDVLRTSIYVKKSYLDPAHFFYLAWIVPIAFLGAWVGKKLISQWTQEKFRTWVSLLLIAMGALMLTRGAWGMMKIDSKASAVLTQESSALKLESLAESFDVLWSIEFLPNQEVLVSERSGKLYELSADFKARSLIGGVPAVKTGGQGGLLDIAVHPDFAKTKRVYLTYSKAVGEGRTTAVGYARLESDRLVDFKEIFAAEPAQKTSLHFGSRMVFDQRGHLFFSVGDRGSRELAQDLSTHMGKIIRLTEDGKVPSDNPFVGRVGAKPEIWSYGHRNPQGVFFDFERSQLWINEHGPRGGDELNLVVAGKNYGWPLVTYGREYFGPKIGEGVEKPGTENPVYQWTPSIAPSSLIRYQGNHIPDLKDVFVSGALALTHLNLLKLDPQKPIESRLFTREAYRIRDVIQGPDGLLYMTTDDGRVLRARPGS
jgi:glucose/arabinose dehydrogenase/uncharacterized membrane protein YfcA